MNLFTSPLFIMSTFLADLGLIDLMHQLTGHNQFKTHAQGLLRIDYILCMEHIVASAMVGCYTL